MHGALVCSGDLRRESRELGKVRRALMHFALPTKWVNPEQLLTRQGAGLGALTTYSLVTPNCIAASEA